MTWIAIDCDLFDHPKMAGLPNDSARYGWLLTLSKAKRQRNAGTFASAKHFAHVLGRYGRFVKAYVEAGLLEAADDGSLVIHDWRKHQWAASKARLREDDDETSRGPNVDTSETESGLARASRAVAVSVDESPSVENEESGTLRARRPALEILAWMRSAGCLRVVGKVLLDLEELAERHGSKPVIEAMETLGPGLDAAQFVYGARNVLHPIPSGRRQTEEERKAAERADVVARAKRGEFRAVPG